MKKETLDIGTFEVVSTTLRITDPCYDRDTWCAGTVENALPGIWSAKITKVDHEDNWGNRCRTLLAYHPSFKQNQKFTKLPIDVGVDSGQAGIFDEQFFKVDYDEDYLQVGNAEYDFNSLAFGRGTSLALDEARIFLEKDPKVKERLEAMLESRKNFVPQMPSPKPTRDWYEVCCDKTLSNVGAGAIRNGVVSSSGDGDGSYDAYAAYDKDGRVVAVKIKF